MPTCTLQPASSTDPIEVTWKPYPVPGIIPGFQFGRVAANGERYGVDYGTGADVYFIDATFFGEAEDMDALSEWMQIYGRGVFRVTEIDGLQFPPNVDQSGDVSVVVVSRDPEGRVFFSPGSGVNEHTLRLRVVSPSFTGTPSLAGLTFVGEYTGWGQDSVTVPFTIDGTPSPVDQDADAGVFTATFRDGDTAIANALRYLMTVREEAFSMPEWTQYPFGAARGGLPKACKCTSFSLARHDLTNWDLTLTLSESFEETA